MSHVSNAGLSLEETRPHVVRAVLEAAAAQGQIPSEETVRQAEDRGDTAITICGLERIGQQLVRFADGTACRTSACSIALPVLVAV